MCLLAFACISLLCMYVSGLNSTNRLYPPHPHLKKWNYSFALMCVCECMCGLRRNSWLQLFFLWLLFFFPHIVNLRAVRRKTPSVFPFSPSILNPSLRHPSLPGACFLINSNNCAEEVKQFMCGSAANALVLWSKRQSLKHMLTFVCVAVTLSVHMCVASAFFNKPSFVETWKSIKRLPSDRNGSIDWLNW